MLTVEMRFKNKTIFIALKSFR